MPRLMLLLLFIPAVVCSQEIVGVVNSKDTSLIIDRNTIYLKDNFFSLNAVCGDSAYDVTKKEFRNLIKDCPKALGDYKSYKLNRSLYYCFYTVGTCCSIFLPPVFAVNHGGPALIWSSLAGGICLMGISIPFSIFSENDLYHCVWEFNKFKIAPFVNSRAR